MAIAGHHQHNPVICVWASGMHNFRMPPPSDTRNQTNNKDDKQRRPEHKPDSVTLH